MEDNGGPKKGDQVWADPLPVVPLAGWVGEGVVSSRATGAGESTGTGDAGPEDSGIGTAVAGAGTGNCGALGEPGDPAA